MAERGHKVSCAKAQMVETKVTYRGVQITHGSRRVRTEGLGLGFGDILTPKIRTLKYRVRVRVRVGLGFGVRVKV